MDVSIEKYKLFINQKLVELPYPVSKFFKYDGGVVVIMNTRPSECRDNVFFINADGTIRWQIEPFSYVEKPMYTRYTSIFERNGELHTFMFDGFDCHIDPKTGKILSRDFVK